ncbi:MAG: hypothetical protein CBB71_19890 [Rhodopirellula sp. TMED11]|nr:MAG: hypothetical protein CBB71_19890 [Rhodopirellula sp. TMED11]
MRFLLLACLPLLSMASLVAGHPLVANQGGTLAWFDTDGNCSHQMNLKGAPHDIHILENGNVLTHQGTEIIEIDSKSHDVVWSYNAGQLKSASTGRVELHSFSSLPNGNLMVALSGEGKIFEIDRAGKVLSSFAMKLNNPHPHRDTRLVRLVPKGDSWNYIVAHEGDGMVREYDRKGNVVWDYEVPMFGKKPAGGHGPEAFGNSLFSAQRLANGNTLIGGGNGHSVLEVTPEKEIVWQLHQNDLPGITLAWVTTVTVLDNGNYVIGNCHAGPDNPQLIEVTKNKEVVWTLKDFKVLGNSVSNSALLP